MPNSFSFLAISFFSSVRPSSLPFLNPIFSPSLFPSSYTTCSSSLYLSQYCFSSFGNGYSQRRFAVFFPDDLCRDFWLPCFRTLPRLRLFLAGYFTNSQAFTCLIPSLFPMFTSSSEMTIFSKLSSIPFRFPNSRFTTFSSASK